jgi:hypothetical protein
MAPNTAMLVRNRGVGLMPDQRKIEFKNKSLTKVHARSVESAFGYGHPCLAGCQAVLLSELIELDDSIQPGLTY